MFLTRLLRLPFFLAAVFFNGLLLSLGQTASAPAGQKKTPKVTAPQVVTIVHRLNGLKMFRLLLRSEGQGSAISSLDDAFNLMNDVHTNVIAGLAMEDGQTIAAWLPEADIEFGLPMAAFPNQQPQSAEPLTPGGRTPGLSAGNLRETPDLTVIVPDGRKLTAHYVGLDGVTGLSILRLADPAVGTTGLIADDKIGVGQEVRVFGPEPAAQTRQRVAGSLYVRVAEVSGRIQKVMRSPGGGLARLKVSSPQWSMTNVGGVALNQAGQTVGIVNAINGTEANVLPASLIRLAANRVLTRQASVPKPWLGVRGEPVSSLNIQQIQNHGWKLDRAESLAQDHRGILLTWIAPGSPAFEAELRPGDVILKVNENTIESGDDFSWLLEQAGTSKSANFVVARPDTASTAAVSVKLSESLDSGFSFRPLAHGFSLFDQGIEVIALRPPAASRLGAKGGLLVVYVEPSTTAFEAGLRPGDLIQSIDGRPVARKDDLTLLSNRPGGVSNFEVIRQKQRVMISIVRKTPKDK